MTNERRFAIISAMSKKHADDSTVTPAKAREVLIAEGIYTADGALSPEYGGEKPTGRRSARDAER